MSEPGKVHRYHASCRWNGSTAAGYEAYARNHSLSAAPAETVIAASSDPAFRGDPTRLNPEQLLVMAAASCQMLSFLAIAARARLDVVEYEDHTDGFMPEDDKPMRITRIVLKPRITVKGEANTERLRKLVHTAHEQCFIANSLKTQIEIQPEFVTRA